MNNSSAIDHFQKLIDTAKNLTELDAEAPKFESWLRRSQLRIADTFGKNSEQLADFNSISFLSMLMFPGRTLEPDRKAFSRGLVSAVTLLQNFIEEIETYGIPYNCKDSSRNPIQDIVRICSRFHHIGKQLEKRYSNREKFPLEDEYDVQDLFHALLKLHFDDVRSEEWTPSYAGSASRVDFLIKEAKVVIEIKKTRVGLKDKQIGEQLIIDKEKYKIHQDCATLVCFVYDPDGYISNPVGIENDLNSDSDEMKVKVIIEPK